MARFDRTCITFYYSAIVTLALSCTICELNDVEKHRDLEIYLSGHSRLLKLVPFKSLGAVFLFAFYSNYGRIFSHFGDIQRHRVV